MRLPRRGESKSSTRLTEAVILFSVGGTVFAIAASAVDEIRNADGLHPLVSPLVQSRVSKVRNTIEREGRKYYVVDATSHFRMLPACGHRVLVLRGANVAVLVERIDRMAEISAIYSLPRAFTGEERQWYRGLALMPGQVEVVPVVNPAAFLTDEEVRTLEGKSKGAKA